MSLKAKRHKDNMENQNMSMSSSDLGTTAKNTLETIVGTINDNKLLIGGIAAGCGAAIFLLTTDSGKDVRKRIQEGAEDLYDFVSEQVEYGWGELRGVAEKVMSGEDVQEVSGDIRRVA